jgi:uncharacterized integral membrane protein (TIGR00698 family)
MNWSLLPPVCLGLGLTGGLTLSHIIAPRKSFVSKWGKTCLQVSVVLLGFSVPLADVWQAGREGFLLALGTIVSILAAGLLLAKALRTPSRLAALVAAGTAICGGSAIAALAPVLGADADEVAASLATVFLLNAVALFLFPVLGHAFALSPVSFGHWAALAIHDTSSVVGAALAFSPESLPTAATVKLARALWIVPLCLAAAAFLRHRRTHGDISSTASPTTRPRRWAALAQWVPWFIPGFLAASFVRAFLPAPLTDVLGALSKVGFALSLFLIGLGINKGVFFRAGRNALGLGLLLWIGASMGTFLLVAR